MQISVFTTSNCAQCMMTKRQFDKLGIRYDEIALEQHPELVEKFKDMGLMSAPIVVTDTKKWSGFRLDKIKSLANYLFSEGNNGRLD
jgi:glutaredoxin-like protein NrdH